MTSYRVQNPYRRATDVLLDNISTLNTCACRYAAVDGNLVVLQWLYSQDVMFELSSEDIIYIWIHNQNYPE
jgi:hypothetical protein